MLGREVAVMQEEEEMRVSTLDACPRASHHSVADGAFAVICI